MTETKLFVFPKDFIKDKLIPSIDTIVKASPYFSFVMLSTAIEFLGKCYNNEQEWNSSWSEFSSRNDFKNGVKKLHAKYHSKTHLLKDSVRNGFCHSFMPKKGVRLTTVNDNIDPVIPHLSPYNNSTIIVAEILWEDIKEALQKVINTDFSSNPNDKMNKPCIVINIS